MCTIKSGVLGVFGVILLVLGLPVTLSAEDTQCCCFPTMANMGFIVEDGDCLQEDFSPHRNCGQCSQTYAVSLCGYGCKKDDDCDGDGEVGCWGQIHEYNLHEAVGNPDISLCSTADPYCPYCNTPGDFGEWPPVEDICDPIFCQNGCVCPPNHTNP